MADGQVQGLRKTSIIDVPRGLFLLRYKQSKAANPPLVTFESLPGQAATISVLQSPDAPTLGLDRPGDVVALASSGNVKIRIMVEARTHDGSTDASIDLEPLSVRSNAQQVGGLQANKMVAAIDDVALALVGHVARRGDVMVAAGEWIGGPSDPAPIEGLQIRLEGASQDLVMAQCLIAGAQRWSDWQGAGTFLGSKGRARPLVGLRIRLNSHAPVEMVLRGSALFLGSAMIKREGKLLELVSAAGRDPLIGLSLALGTEMLVRSNASQTPVAPTPGASRGKVRVFRAGAEVGSSRVGASGL